MIAYTMFVLAVGAERLVELAVSKRNLAWAFAHGGKEYGRGHYPAMVLLHFVAAGGLRRRGAGSSTGRFCRCWAGPWSRWCWRTQALRWWCIGTLGRRWNTLIVVVPGMPLVNRGPYRWLRHPNYVAVVIEGIALPMVHTAWITAVTFTVLNAVLLRVRIRAEEDALAQATAAPVTEEGARSRTAADSENESALPRP